ncbi:MAG: RNA polymerase sigma factor [Thermoleophilaceae bacterium]
MRLQGDERLVALIRQGHHGAFEALVQRYQPRLLAFCRHMLGSQEDAEDVLQEVFAAAFNAIRADERHINARPWLYRIARNRCLNHLRRPQPTGQDSMDIFERDGGTTTADTVHKREEFRHIVADVQDLPETQRSALLLREIDALSYDQIAEAMDTTVPSVKSLLVRARVSLAEASEARLLTCDEVRLELGEVAEGLGRSSAPVRRHLRQCERCRIFKGELRKSSRALAAVYPIGPFVLLKLSLAKLGLGGASAATSGGGAAAGGAGLAGGTAGGISASGAVSAGIGTLATKATVGMAAAVIVTAGAVEVRHSRPEAGVVPSTHVASAPPPATVRPAAPDTTRVKVDPTPKPVVRTAPAPVPPPTPPQPAAKKPDTVQKDSSTVTLETAQGESATPPPGEPTEPASPPGESTGAPQQPPPAPPAGEPTAPAPANTPATTGP